jgi:hypothetical protein
MDVKTHRLLEGTDGGRPAAEAPASGPATARWLLPRRRRRTALLVLGIVLVLVGGSAGGWLVTRAGDKVPVLAVARPVGYGTIIEDADLAVARVAPDAALFPLPAGDRSRVVGQYAAVELRAGTLLTDEQITAEPVLDPASELVGVAVAPSQLPNRPLQAGDRVLVVSTPSRDADPPAGRPGSITGTVVGVGAPDVDRVRVIDVRVPAGTGPTLAAWVATGRVAIVLVPPAVAG